MLRVSTAVAGAALWAWGSVFSVSVLWGLLVWKAGASPGSVTLSLANRWVGGALGQQQLPFLALDTKSIHVGWEKASSDLLILTLPCPSRSAPSQRTNAIRRREGSANAGTGRGVGRKGHGPELICISPWPAPQGLGKAPCSAHRLCLLWPNLATVSAPGAQGLFQLRASSV